MAQIKTMHSYYNSLNFRTKLLLNLFIVNILIIISVIGIYHFIFTGNIHTQVLGNVETAMNRLATDVGCLMTNMSQTSDRIAMDYAVRTACMAQEERRDFDQQLEDYAYLKKFVGNNFSNNTQIFTTIYFKQATIYTNRDQRFLTMDKMEDFPWADRLDMQYGSLLWTEPFQMAAPYGGGGQLLGSVRVMRDFNYSTGYYGILSVYIKEKEMQTILRGVVDVYGSEVLLVNDQRFILSASEPGKAGHQLAEFPQYDMLKSEGEMKQNQTIRTNQGEFFLNTLEIPNSGWHLVALTPFDYFHQQKNEALVMSAIIFSVLCAVMLSLDSVLSHSLTKRLEKVLSQVVLPSGELTPPIRENQEFHGEIQQLIQAFSGLQDKNKALSAHILEEELAKKEATLLLLQSQIDSHFLYNSLDVINWMAMEHGSDDIVEMVQLLSRYYRLSLAKGADIVTIEEELRHAQIYLDIQKIRFADQIQYHIEADESVTAQKITKLVLQPLIENAVIHGLMEKENPGGYILIKAYRKEKVVTIEVIDDGVGMSPEKAAAINQGTLPRSSESIQGGGSHFGIRNIKERLALYYKTNASLEVESSVRGTTVRITILSSMQL